MTPTIETARQWALNSPGQGVSSYACRFPGLYAKAARLAREARKELIP